MFALAQHRW